MAEISLDSGFRPQFCGLTRPVYLNKNVLKGRKVSKLFSIL